jgi:hypothetical protein
MDESKESFKSHTDRRISEMSERVKKFRKEKIKERMNKVSQTHRKKDNGKKRRKNVF